MEIDASVPFVDLFRMSLPFHDARPWLTKGKIEYDKFGWPKKLLTQGATFGPAFRIANFTRDTMHVALMRKSFIPFWDSGIGLYKSLVEDEDFVKFMASGAGFGTNYIDADNPEATTKYINKVYKKEGQGAVDRILATPKMMLSFWEKLGSASENAARVQVYAKAKREGKSHTDAAFEARDLLDFTMRGEHRIVGMLIQSIPFLNARMQGLYRLGSAINKENYKNFLLKGAMISIGSMALMAANTDREEWKELELWDKATYYHFWVGDKHYRIPKPFEVGAIFSTFVESAMDVDSGNEEMSYIYKMLWHTATQTFAVGLPQTVVPALEQYSNKSNFTGRPIVGPGLDGLDREAQYDPWTSKGMVGFGEMTTASPKRMEALIKAFASTYGEMFLGVSDVVASGLMDFPEQPTKRIDDYPMIGRFVKQKSPARYTKYQTWFYEKMEELSKAQQTYNHYVQTGDYKRALGSFKKDYKKIALKKGLNKYQRQLSGLNRKIKEIHANPMLNSGQKTKVIDALSKQRNVVVKTLYKAYGDILK